MVKDTLTTSGLTESKSTHMIIAIRSQSTLIIAEHNNEKLNAATLNAVTAAGQLGGEVKLAHKTKYDTQFSQFSGTNLLSNRNMNTQFSQFSSHSNSGELLGGRNWLCSCCQGGCCREWGYQGETISQSC